MSKQFELHAIVADDVEQFRNQAVDIIRNANPNIKIKTVATGNELYKKVTSDITKYFLIFTDDDMEKQGIGQEIIRGIRAKGFTGLIIMLSSTTGKSLAKEAGADYYLDKGTFYQEISHVNALIRNKIAELYQEFESASANM